LVYSTYLGGSAGGETQAYAIAVDSEFNAYVGGATNESDYPVTSGAFQTVCGPVAGGGQFEVPSCGGNVYGAFRRGTVESGAGEPRGSRMECSPISPRASSCFPPANRPNPRLILTSACQTPTLFSVTASAQAALSQPAPESGAPK